MVFGGLVCDCETKNNSSKEQDGRAEARYTIGLISSPTIENLDGAIVRRLFEKTFATRMLLPPNKIPCFGEYQFPIIILRCILQYIEMKWLLASALLHEKWIPPVLVRERSSRIVVYKGRITLGHIHTES